MASKAEALAWIQSWEAAQTGLQANASYTLSFPNGTSRTVQRVDMTEVREQITYWNRVYNALDAADRGAREKGHITPSWI